MKKVIAPILDAYFKRPILWDIIIVLVGWLISWGLPFFFNVQFLVIPDKSGQLSYLSNLSSTSVTLAGFIIAALTILITVKSSLKARGFEDSANAMEYIFSSKHYPNIVRVFIDSIIELILFFIFLYVGWLLSENIKTIDLYRLIVSSTFGIIASLLRSLYVLFKVLLMENLPKV